MIVLPSSTKKLYFMGLGDLDELLNSVIAVAMALLSAMVAALAVPPPPIVAPMAQGLEDSLVSSLSLPVGAVPCLVCLEVAGGLPSGFFTTTGTLLLHCSECLRFRLRFLGDCGSSTDLLTEVFKVRSGALLGSTLTRVSSSLYPEGALPAPLSSASELSRCDLTFSSDNGEETPILSSSLGDPEILDIVESGVVGGVLSMTGAASSLSRL